MHMIFVVAIAVVANISPIAFVCVRARVYFVFFILSSSVSPRYTVPTFVGQTKRIGK